jgi:hypothetical protein
VTHAPWPLLAFCARPTSWTGCSTLLMETPAVIWFQEMNAQVPKT